MKITSILILLLSLVFGSITSAQQFTPLYKILTPGGYSVFIDYDSDGDSDLLTSGVIRNNEGATLLYRNDNNVFTEVEENFSGVTGDIRIMDYDHDGDSDVIFIGSPAPHGGINLFLNNGGDFGEPVSLYGGDFGVYQRVDFDGDGNQDLLGMRSGSIGVFQFVVNPFVFPSTHQIETSHGWSIVAIDLNKDGVRDFIVYNSPGFSYSKIITYYSGGSFYVKGNDLAGLIQVSYPSFYAQDFDLDGDEDLLVIGSLNDQRITQVFRNTDGVFEKITDPFLENVAAMRVDFNNDGVLDFTCSENGKAVFYLNDQARTKLPDNSVFYYAPSFTSVAFSPLSINNDELLCISGTIGYPNHVVTIIYKKEAGEYKPITGSPIDPEEPYLVKWVDYNKDGLADVFTTTTNQYGSTPKLFRNTGGDLVVAHEFLDGSVGDGDWDDFNNDGYVDYISVAQKKVSLLEGFTTGDYKSTTLLNAPPAFGGVYNLESSTADVIDFDNDGDNDLLVIDYQNGLFVNKNGVLEKNWPDITLYSSLDYGWDWGDYDKDGDQDLAIYGQYNGLAGVNLLKNNNGKLERVNNTGFPTNWARGNPKWIDFDQDGDLDLFMTGSSFSFYRYGLYRNDNGTFVNMTFDVFDHLADNLEFWGWRTRVVDYNLDGYPDIVVSASDYRSGSTKTPRYLSFIKNNSGAFELDTNTGIPDIRAASFDFKDFEGDGDPDLLITGRIESGYFTQIYLNKAADTMELLRATLSPASNSVIGISENYELSITFNKVVKKGTGSLSIYRSSDDVMAAKIDINSQSVTTTGNTFKVAVGPGTLQNFTSYYILCNEGLLVDYSGKHSAAIIEKSEWSFTIGSVKSQTITFGPLTRRNVDDPPFVLTATASSGLAISYASSNTSVATISNDKVTILGEGSTDIVASQAGNAMYEAATPVTQTLVVVKTPVSPVTGIEDSSKGLSVFPNPATSSLFVSSDSFVNDPVWISVEDTYGHSLIRFGSSNIDQIEVNLTDLPKGMYVLTLTQGKEVTRTKFVKH